MKKIKYIFLLLLISSFVIFTTSCKKEKKKDENTEVIVTFNLMEGTYKNSTEYPVVKVTKGDTIKSFTPEKTGYIFQGWTTNLVQSMSVDFKLDTPITENTVLYAVWRKPQLKLHNNEGIITSYSSIDEIIYEFLRDFNIFTNQSSIDARSFFDRSYNRMASFFMYNESKWMGFYNYLKDNAHENNKSAFEMLFIKDEELDSISSRVRAEISGFLTNKMFYDHRYSFLTSSDYSDRSLQESIFTYLPDVTPTFYVSSFDYTLPIPHKSGYKFEGWYENENYEGEPITMIPANSTKDYELYAKWSQK